MFKNTGRSFDFYFRMGSASTVASRTGRNLLDWGSGVQEKLTPRQALECLQARARQLHALPAEEREPFNKELGELNQKIAELKPRVYGSVSKVGLERHIIDACKARMSERDFKLAVNEAIREKIECDKKAEREKRSQARHLTGAMEDGESTEAQELEESAQRADLTRQAQPFLFKRQANLGWPGEAWQRAPGAHKDAMEKRTGARAHGPGFELAVKQAIQEKIAFEKRAALEKQAALERQALAREAKRAFELAARLAIAEKLESNNAVK